VVEGRNPFDRETTVATFHAILMADLPVPACPPPLGTVIAGLLVRGPEQRITTAHARQLLTGGAGWDSAPAVVGGTAGRAGPATHPGNQALYGTPTYPVTVGTAKPQRGRRVALLAGAGAAAVAAIVAIALTVLHPGSSGTPSAKTSTTGSARGAGTALASPAAATTPATPAATTPATSAGASAGGGLPSAYLGQWQGTLADNIGLEGPQPAHLTIANGTVNSVVGSASYPNVGCTYSLQLTEAQAGKVTMHEQVQSGPCVADWVVLTPDGSGLAENVYSVSISQGRPDFSGHISRAS
jgi:hypothetical protein